MACCIMGDGEICIECTLHIILTGMSYLKAKNTQLQMSQLLCEGSDLLPGANVSELASDVGCVFSVY